MALGLFDYIHSWVDWGLACSKMVQNREIGWVTKNRKTGAIMREKQPLAKKIRLLLLFNPLTEWIDGTKALRYWLHHESLEEGDEMRKPETKKNIRPFVEFFEIDMSQFEPSDIDAYPNFQEFFIRKHKAGARPIAEPDNPSVAVVAADCRLVVYPTISQATALWIKGRHFTIANLIADPTGETARTWDGGAIASFRLSPQDYHRYHAPVNGKVKWWKEIDGQYYGVDPLCVGSDVDILTENARCAVCFESEQFGDVLFVAIGATDVGTVQLNEYVKTVGHQVKKGDEVGLFEFGGSSIVVAFERGRIEFDEDLVKVSEQRMEMDVEVGMSLGRWVKQ
ncbi:phosphatidylserine decarboxylase [Gloeophyllum trabeum ATCC 11539]|uniref:phosphatidylserine decarboxylase n=1 Tax=Gloeophyllum trabeum (strain ATCC 11539 / FP-39264 / Madison 617) TaxID=670483 RepID=S7RLR2_GLOTA|nr:phosphatidylserine decarboxylase [Gloeophyllum trabeum ATCC 11539]EPQ55345.1 phosphatidylserine decarboxylase [Gloeophyllum trabeum ATCC 11539]